MITYHVIMWLAYSRIWTIVQWIIYVHRIICWDDDGAYVYVGTQMELSISFSDLIHAYKGLSVNALNDYMRTRVLKMTGHVANTRHTIVICPHILLIRVLSKQITLTMQLYSFQACHDTHARNCLQWSRTVHNIDISIPLLTIATSVQSYGVICCHICEVCMNS